LLILNLARNSLDNLETLQDDAYWEDYFQFLLTWFQTQSKSRLVITSRQRLKVLKNSYERGNLSDRIRSIDVTGLELVQGVNYEQAIDYQQQSLEIDHQIGDRNGEANSLCNLGIAYKSLGQYEQAIDFYQQSLHIQREIGNRSGEANSLGNLGIAYRSLGQYEQAIDYLRQSLDIQREIGDRWGVGASLLNMAIAQARLDNHGEAMRNLQQAQSIYEDLKLDHMVEQCEDAIRNCNKIIAAKRITPPLAPSTD
jgi:tetratricopeptide (TPR) repeat protein